MRLKNPQNADYPLFFFLLSSASFHSLACDLSAFVCFSLSSLPFLCLRICRSDLISIDIDII